MPVLKLNARTIGRSRDRASLKTLPASYNVRQVPDGLMVNRIESHLSVPKPRRSPLRGHRQQWDQSSAKRKPSALVPPNSYRIASSESAGY